MVASLSGLNDQLLKLNNRHFAIADAIVFAIAPLLALGLCFDGAIDLAMYEIGLLAVTVVFLTIKFFILNQWGFYQRYWRYASVGELAQIAELAATVIVVQSLCFGLFYRFGTFSIDLLPRSLPLLDGLVSFLVVGGLRFSIRAVEQKHNQHREMKSGERVLIVGAGAAGISLVQEMQRQPDRGYCPVAFVDDDPGKLNLNILGIPVVGNRHDIPHIVRTANIQRITIAIPSASGAVIRDIVDLCQATGIPTTTLPGLHEIVNGRIRLGNVRGVKIEDLLRREPIQTDIEGVMGLLKGKKVLVTGAGGSIGSELCRQIMSCHPAEILLVGHGENSVFQIEQELKQRLTNAVRGKHKNASPEPTRLRSFIADLRFRDRLEHAFERFRPDFVFHAAAHKHVPMMEVNPPEAITNNILGTQNLVELALKYDVKRFVTISTDKAINPTNVMGASKRVAEMLVLQAARTSGKPFVVVRFGNVLGSRGSVVPTFQKQIEAGGPVTITHPDICRYFMTIPEAVQLVLQASVMSQGGEVFMLNMGEPVKIVDLARDLIRLSGYEVDRDIKIKFTGLRPGEKLFEELLIPGEKYEPTAHEKLLMVPNASQMVPETLDLTVKALGKAAFQNNTGLILFLLEQLVAGYTPKYPLDNPRAA
ncbi:MAG TPA: polysaccharide biosynthesis protein [Oscillatoriales cyanobacterium M59_W2019_021]|nr:polysaccharide biosynthesis protein [Oscillatoriales cyanobacterium M4454_W2019_049]HIK52577.1 polysaccharide biosynthesis protein [Oscillatoriales cyanobacterium M59_W2019_021]